MATQTQRILDTADPILVTGASGFIGTRVVQTLIEYGFTNIRCLHRRSSRLDSLGNVTQQAPPDTKIELVAGDLLSYEDCCNAGKGVAGVFHLAAGIDKSFAGAFMNSALATRNLLKALHEHGRPKRFVNVSSFAVYSNYRLGRGALLDETCPVEDAPQERFDAYGFGKLKQDEIVMECGKQFNVPYVILRPGTVFGPGKPALTGRIGIDTFGVFFHLGGGNQLPLTYVDNCAEAIVLAGITPGIDGEIFNVVDDSPLSSRQFLRAYKRKVRGFFSLRIPYSVAKLGCFVWETYSRRSGGQLPPVFNRRRCSAEWKGNRYSNKKLRERLGWSPRVDMQTAMSRFLAQFDSNVP